MLSRYVSKAAGCIAHHIYTGHTTAQAEAYSGDGAYLATPTSPQKFWDKSSCQNLKMDEVK